MHDETTENNHTLSTFSVEQKNRTILILILVLLLSVFMDYQAKRHYKTIASEMKQTDLNGANGSLEDSSNWYLQGNQIVEKKPADQIIEQKVEFPKGQNANLDQTAQQKEIQKRPITATQPIPTQTHNILSKFTHLREEFNQALKKQTAAELQQIAAKSTQASTILANDKQGGNPAKETIKPPDLIQYAEQHYFLYFIRFDGKKSNLVRVRRPYQGSSLYLGKVLQALRQGPNSKEKGLLNNFDHRIKINSVTLAGRSVIVDLNPAIGRMGTHVINDRLEQLAHTLTQFRQIDYVRVLIEGKVVSHIGNAKVVLPQALRPKRPSVDFVP